jgi:hypothetical protein
VRPGRRPGCRSSVSLLACMIRSTRLPLTGGLPSGLSLSVYADTRRLGARPPAGGPAPIARRPRPCDRAYATWRGGSPARSGSNGRPRAHRLHGEPSLPSFHDGSCKLGFLPRRQSVFGEAFSGAANSALRRFDRAHQDGNQLAASNPPEVVEC